MLTLTGHNIASVRDAQIALAKIDGSWIAAGHTCAGTVAGALTCHACATRKIAKISTTAYKPVAHDKEDQFGSMRSLVRTFIDAGLPIPAVYADHDPEVIANREAQAKTERADQAKAHAIKHTIYVISEVLRCAKVAQGNVTITQDLRGSVCTFQSNGNFTHARPQYKVTAKESMAHWACDDCAAIITVEIAKFDAWYPHAEPVEIVEPVEVVATVPRALTQYQIDRVERAQDRAVSLARKADEIERRVSKMVEGIPFGQPILVGHHSEKRDRNYRERIANTCHAAHEAAESAHDAARIAENAGQTISSDDPDAVEALRAKLEDLESQHNRMKRANPLAKRGDVEGLIAMGFSAKVATDLTHPDFAGRIGFAPYMLTNSSANLKRIRERIASLEIVKTQTDVHIEGKGWIVRSDHADNRIAVEFDTKPAREILDALRRAAFLWSPSRGYHVRKITPAANHAAREIVKMLDKSYPLAVVVADDDPQGCPVVAITTQDRSTVVVADDEPQGFPVVAITTQDRSTVVVVDDDPQGFPVVAVTTQDRSTVVVVDDDPQGFEATAGSREIAPSHEFSKISEWSENPPSHEISKISEWSETAQVTNSPKYQNGTTIVIEEKQDNNQWYASLSGRMRVDIAINVKFPHRFTKRGRYIEISAREIIAQAQTYVNGLSSRERLEIEGGLKEYGHIAIA